MNACMYIQPGVLLLLILLILFGMAPSSVLVPEDARAMHDLKRTINYLIIDNIYRCIESPPAPCTP